MSLRAHLLMLTLALLAPVMIFAVAVGYALVEQERETFRRGAEERTLAMSTAVDTALASSIATLQALATSPALDRNDLATFRDRAARVLAMQPQWFSIHLALPSGQQVMNLQLPEGGALPDNAALDSQWQSVVQRGAPSINDLIVGPATQEWHFTARLPVRRDGSIRYILSAAVKPDWIRALLDRQNVPADWVAVVLDKNGRIVARTFEPEQSVGKIASRSLRDALARSPSGWFRGTTIEGDAVYTPYRRSAETGWTFAMGIPASVVDAAAWRAGAALALGLLAAALIAIALARAIGNRIARPIVALASAATAMRNGQPAQITESATVAEIRMLETTLRSSVQDLGERARLLDLAQDAIVVSDASKRVLYWNRGAEAIYGWRREEVTGKILYEVLRTEFPEPLSRIMDELRLADQWSGELAQFTRDGRRIVVASRWAAERDRQGELARILEINSDVSERKRAEVALKEADRAKDQFLATLGHELRNPLAALVNAVHVLKRAEPGRATAADAIGVLERQTKHMTRLVGDLLDLSRLTMGKLVLHREATELMAVVAETARTWKARADTKQISIVLQAPGGAAWIHADRDRIEQVLSNLLDNALKFSDAGGQVTVEVRIEGTDAVLRVSDRGAGIPAEALEQVFTHFVQGDEGRSRGGLGIGLAVVKQLVELHGGTVSAASDGVGRGATFTVRLPAIARTVEPARRTEAFGSPP
ncbi:MAG TPA: ATP-binding protein [Burkholderiales bacterium]|nr:ATP-binding protein [Burkholderiales bacterium]